MYSIYTINNVLDDSVLYVGMTSQSLEKRLRQHATKKKCVMYSVLKDIGLNNIVIKEIDKADTKQEAFKIEAEWTKQLGTEYELMNTDYGSRLGQVHIDSIREKKMGMPCYWARKPVFCTETGKVYESVLIASAETGVCQSSISKALCGHQKMAGGKHFSYVNA